MDFSDWLLTHCNMHLKFFHVFLWHDSTFHFSNEYYSTVWVYYSLLIYSHTEAHLDCFHILAIMNKVTLKLYVHAGFCVNISFQSL